MNRTMKAFFYRLPLQSKLIFIFLVTSIISFSATVYMNRNINRKLEDIDKVYKSNAQLNNLANSLGSLQSSMKDYLDTKTSSSLTEYYEYQQDYHDNMELLNQRIIDNESAIMEKNIYNISNRYLEESEKAIMSKRARNISQYKVYYDDASQLYDYLNAYIFSLNNEQFMTNSSNYVTLAASLRLLERVSSLLSVTVIVFNIIVIVMLTGQITKPLRALTETANEVATGNFDVREVRVTGEDEIAIVSNAFNKMVLSIKEYIRRLTESIELENKAKERELLMKNHLKDAQLKYYQAQIHPHFLFNSLNAGAQMAMMENAEKTYLFIQKMSEFFRASMNHISMDVPLQEELTLVENYLYIMNVRFSGEIHYEQTIGCDIGRIRVPSMIIQPVIENSIQYGIRNIEWQGKINLRIEEGSENYRIIVQDNGMGISPKRLEEIRLGKRKSDENKDNSNGIGLGNVIQRLELYYQQKDLFLLESNGINMGTTVTIQIPKEGRKRNV